MQIMFGTVQHLSRELLTIASAYRVTIYKFAFAEKIRCGISTVKSKKNTERLNKCRLTNFCFCSERSGDFDFGRISAGGEI
jgi:hypothetical protein